MSVWPAFPGRSFFLKLELSVGAISTATTISITFSLPIYDIMLAYIPFLISICVQLRLYVFSRVFSHFHTLKIHCPLDEPRR